MLDVGLTDAQRGWCTELGVGVVSVHAHPETTRRREDRALTLVPKLHIAEYVPGFDILVWLDADTWVQHPGCIRALADTAADGALAIVPELDPAYAPMFDGGEKRAKWSGIYRKCFGRRVAKRLIEYPVLNSGVFALRADTPLWDAWRAAIRDAGRAWHFDQPPLNKAVWLDGFDKHLLPSLYNWICGQALPAYDEPTGRMLTPYPPHHVISVLHLTKRREGVYELTTLKGSKVQRSLH